MMPSLSTSSSSGATGGTVGTPFYEGDVVLATGNASAGSGDRTAPAGDAGVLAGSVSQVARNLGGPLLIAAVIVLGALAWKRKAG